MHQSGISPNDLSGIISENGEVHIEESLEQIQELAKQKKVVAIGEIGLDYYWNKENKELQQEIFIKQIEMANELSLPIIVHTRDAVEDIIDILKNKKQCKNKGVFHCCPLNRELIKEVLKLDYYVSFAGPVTFKNAKSADEVIDMVPLERMVIETDCPYLSPDPLRGRRNDSRNLKYIAEKIANVKGMKVEEIAEITYSNAKELFRIK